MREAPIEKTFSNRLEGFGFRCIKCALVNLAGAPDRMIIRPKWSPGPISFVEFKAPTKKLRTLQEQCEIDLTKRGIKVWPYVDTQFSASNLIIDIVGSAVAELRDDQREAMWAESGGASHHIYAAWKEYERRLSNGKQHT